ncbi:MAG: HAMP domain-containing protein [Zoogloeaceae bacterium]|nr:HAMP domain-containing protein [Zoogloeaceae bacterium]
MNLLPRTLFARLMLIWLAGLAVVLGVSFWLFLGERERFDRDVLFEGIAREVAAVAEVIERLPPGERAGQLESMRNRRLRFSLDGLPPGATPATWRGALTEALERALPDREVKLFIHNPPPPPHQHDGRPAPPSRLLAVVRLSDGTRLAVRLPNLSQIPDRPASPERILAALAALVAGIGVLSWIAVRVATRPLSDLAEAARVLGEDPERGDITAHGPAEVAQAAGAFRLMQQRIREHIAERTRILAAISHDLQTPITRLRLRTEQIDDEALRGRVQADLDDMQAMVREGLAYARSLENGEAEQRLDLSALIGSLVDDAQEMGWRVQLVEGERAVCSARPTALRRSLWNLIENGVKFGGRVEVAIEPGPMVVIRDHGPGLPDEELERVFEPFYRTESSRNRDTGGTGLGLAIARNLLRVQGGEVTLANAPGGGLVATVRLVAA